MGFHGYALPGWVLYWFYLSSLACIWDAGFILLRPLSFPGGEYHAFWLPYRLYMRVDQRYGDLSDGFIMAVCLMNCAEVAFNILTIFLHNRRSQHTACVGFTVSVMTFWKTVMYFLMMLEICQGHHFRKGNAFWDEVFVVVIPNGIWIIVPGLIMVALWGRLSSGLDVKTAMENISGNDHPKQGVGNGDGSHISHPAGNAHKKGMSKIQ